MNMKESKKMRRLIMCQSLDATSCVIPECRSVIRPRRSSEHTRLLSDTKYIAESRRSLTAKSVKLDENPERVKLDQKAIALSTANQVFQVVVMRVSIHCQGCAGKVKKHLSKMEGVTSFSVDLENKRVTVMGHVSPMAVLESMSKVKKAEFWPPNLSQTYMV